MVKIITKTPSPKGLLQGLRSIGYSFSTAIADLIDNSISADAKNVAVLADCYDQAHTYLAILDDGKGMDEHELSSAMEFGSETEHNFSDSKQLGRFGLGLKTASISQCRLLTVVSKKNGCIHAAQWDLDRLENENSWELVFNDWEVLRQTLPQAQRFEKCESGTMVVWQNFDIMAKETTNFVKTFTSRVSEASAYCALVFHRFYESVNISFNDLRISKRDPFLDKNHHGIPGPEISFPYNGVNVEARAYSLPLKKNLTSEDKSFLGIQHNDDPLAQGFFIYRNNRLISWGNWYGLAHRSFFTKLARIKVDVPSSLDEIWGIDVKKSRAVLPDAFRAQLSAGVNDAISRSEHKETYAGTIFNNGKEKRYWNRVVNGDTVSYEINKENPIIKQLQNDLSPVDRSLLNELLSDLKDYMPWEAIKLDVEKELNPAFSDEIDLEGLKEELLSTINMFNGVDKQSKITFLKAMLSFEKYACLKKYENELLDKIK